MSTLKEFLTEGNASTNIHPFSGLPFPSFWVFLSGKEMLGRKRWFTRSSSWHVLVSLIWLATGACGMWRAQTGETWSVPAYIVSLLLLVGGARYMVATNIHMMAHNQFFRSPSANLWWGEILTTVFFIQSYTRYRADHLKHHGKVFGTLKDGDGLSVVQLGFTPDKTPLELWLNVLKLSVSPTFHFHFARGRLRENLVLCPGYRKLMTAGWLVILGAAGYWFGPMMVIHTYIIPVIFLCQIASLLQLLCEHVWVSMEGPCRTRHIFLTNGRYCGVPLPKNDGRLPWYVVQLAAWGMRIVFVELPARIVVLQGTLPEHDWHHRNPGSRQWYEAPTLRELQIKSDLEQKGHSDYTEIWGSFEILDRVFWSISKSEVYPEMNELLLSGKLDYGDIK